MENNKPYDYELEFDFTNEPGLTDQTPELYVPEVFIRDSRLPRRPQDLSATTPDAFDVERAAKAFNRRSKQHNEQMKELNY